MYSSFQHLVATTSAWDPEKFLGDLLEQSPILVPALIAWTLCELASDLIRKSPFWLSRTALGAYRRLWKEFSLVREITSDRRFNIWRPESGRYIALGAIKAQGTVGATSPVLDQLVEALERQEPVVLLGEPGAGKTTALQALAYRLARQAYRADLVLIAALPVPAIGLWFASPLFSLGWLASFFLWESFARRHAVPIFLEMRSDYAGEKIQEWRGDALKERLGDEPPFGQHRAVLLLDGVNEIQAEHYERFVEGWRARLQQRPSQSVVFTSRPGGEDPSPRLERVHTLTIADLDDEGVMAFLRIYGRERVQAQRDAYGEEQVRRDFVRLREQRLLAEHGIGRNPYWLRMIVESDLYTRNQGRLFRSFAEKLIRREVEEKPERRRRAQERKVVPLEIERDALAALARAMHLDRRVGFGDAEGWRKARETIRVALDGAATPDDVLGEAQAATLMRLVYHDRLEFSHQLVQEFFAATGFAKEPNWPTLVAHAHDVWWWPTLFMAGGLLSEESPERYGALVANVLGNGRDDVRLFAAVGLLRGVDEPPDEVVIRVQRALTAAVGETLTTAQEAAARELGRILGDEAAEAIAPLLASDDVAVQVKGLRLLGAIGGTRAREMQVHALADRQREGQEGPLIDALAVMGDAGQIALVEALCRCTGESIRIRLIEVLARIQCTRAIEPLINALWIPAARPLPAALDVRAQTPGDLLPRHRYNDPSKSARPETKAAADALVALGAAAIPLLIAAVRATFPRDMFERMAAQERARRIRDPAALLRKETWMEAEIPRLEELDRRRAVLLDLISRIGPDALELVVASVREVPAKESGRTARHYYSSDQSPEEATRDALIHALGKSGPVAVDALLALMSSTNDLATRATITRALGHTRSPRAIEPLLQLMREPLEEPRPANAPARRIAAVFVNPIPRAAAEALAQMDDPRVIEPLLDWSRAQSFFGEAMVTEALARIGQPAVGPLLARLEESDGHARQSAIKMLARIGDPAVVDAIGKRLAPDEPHYVRQTAAETLARYRDCRATPYLLGALDDKDEQVREHVARALGELADPRAAERLIATLVDPKDRVRASAAFALGKIGNGAAVPALLPLLKDTDDWVRRSAAGALGQMGGAEIAIQLDAIAAEELSPHVATAARAAAAAIRKRITASDRAEA